MNNKKQIVEKITIICEENETIVEKIDWKYDDIQYIAKVKFKKSVPDWYRLELFESESMWMMRIGVGGINKHTKTVWAGDDNIDKKVFQTMLMYLFTQAQSQDHISESIFERFLPTIKQEEREVSLGEIMETKNTTNNNKEAMNFYSMRIPRELIVYDTKDYVSFQIKDYKGDNWFRFSTSRKMIKDYISKNYVEVSFGDLLTYKVWYNATKNTEEVKGKSLLFNIRQDLRIASLNNDKAN